MKKKKGKVNSTETFISSAKEIHGNKYSYSKTVYVKASDKLLVTCNKHGDFLVTPGNHLYNKQGCKKCHIDSKYSNLDTFIQKAKAVHGDRYCYSKVEYEFSVKKVNLICVKHGDFLVAPASHLSGQGCKKCSHEMLSERYRSDTKEFIAKAKVEHGDVYDYSETVYEKANVKVFIRCTQHGFFSITPSSHLGGSGCRVCSASKGEKFISKILKENDITFTREYRIPEVINRYHYDFYLPDYNLLIEFHGKQHYEAIPFFGGLENLIYTQGNDRNKKYLARKFKYHLLEFNYKQFKHMTTEQFEEMVIARLSKHKKV